MIKNGWLNNASHLPTTHCDRRPDGMPIDLLVIHCISLPPGEFGGGYIEEFFCGNLDVGQHEYFESIANLRVSAHVLIDRQGRATQFVSFDDRAWHAGVSSFNGHEKCNDYSIGIEMEGADDSEYTDEQYAALIKITKELINSYPNISSNRIVAHSEIAPGRKTDPGEFFDWDVFLSKIR